MSGFACPESGLSISKRIREGISVKPYIEECCPICNQKKVFIRKGKYICGNFNCNWSQEVKPLKKGKQPILKTDLNNNRHRDRWIRKAV